MSSDVKRAGSQKLSRGMRKELDAWFDDSKTLSAAFVRRAKQLETAPLDLVLYRGLSLPAGHALLRHRVDDVLTLDQAGGPSSWTTDLATAQSFAQQRGAPDDPPLGGIVVRSLIKAAHIVLDTRRVTALEDEHEVIVDKGTFACTVAWTGSLAAAD